MDKKIFIYTNRTQMSNSIENMLRNKLAKSSLHVFDNFSDDTDLIICIGGDGTLLRLVQEFGFPKTPIVGVNTGHLGFFQEILPEKIDDFIFLYNQDRYSIRRDVGSDMLGAPGADGEEMGETEGAELEKSPAVDRPALRMPCDCKVGLSRRSCR